MRNVLKMIKGEWITPNNDDMCGYCGKHIPAGKKRIEDENGSITCSKKCFNEED